jgi:hypothetical protein
VKRFVKVCLLLVLSGVVTAPSICAQRALAGESPFVPAERFGEASARERTFFLFSTSLAKYILRHDGTGEATSRAGLRRSFYLKVASGERIERVYSLEYEGDLVLLYQAGDTGYVARMNQRSRKVRTVIIDPNFTPPTIKDHHLVFSDGALVAL